LLLFFFFLKIRQRGGVLARIGEVMGDAIAYPRLLASVTARSDLPGTPMISWPGANSLPSGISVAAAMRQPAPITA
jgi:hypothetical protein